MTNSTSRRQLEAEIRRSEQRFRQLFDNSSDAIMTLEPPSWKFTTANHTTVVMFGVRDVTQFVELGPGELSPERQPDGRASVEKAQEMIETALRVGSHYFEWTHRRISGESFPATVRLSRMETDGQVFLQATVRDITERVRAEEAIRSKSEELERFVYTVSHDLRSPVVTVQTFLGHLEQDILANNAGRMATDFEFMHAAADKMAQLLDELLKLSRLGHQFNPPENVLFQDVVKEVLDLVAGRIAQRGVQVTVTGELITLHGDRARFVGLFQNLVDNACKFMDNQPAPRIEIGVETRGAEMIFYVRDNGGGIDPRHQAKVFGLFEKLNTQIEGTGMGLTLVKRIVELHNGRIWVESAGLGQGTCFYFTLPGAIQQPNKGDKL
jgi:signal transduction histidine kinase